MATTKDFHDYVMEQLARVGEISSCRMMGEYCVYYRGRMVAEICDNQLLLKPTPSVLRLLPDAPRAYPYEGSKTLMTVVEDVENTDLLRAVLEAMWPELPEPKTKK